jgi:succinate dehydrogenase/fumarate reductase cytochrome b subunit
MNIFFNLLGGIYLMESQVQQTGTSMPTYPQSSTSGVISVKDWMITILLLVIPIVNIVMLFVWAFGGGVNSSKANYAKASLIWALIGIVLYIVFGLLIFGALMSGLQ